MTNAALQSTTRVKPRRRWLRFSLLTLMLSNTLLCVWFGLISNRANRQRRAVETIQNSGPNVVLVYDFQVDANGQHIDDATPPGPSWLRNLIGIHYFATVAEVAAPFDDRSAAALADLPQITGFECMGKRVTDRVLAKLVDHRQLRWLDISDTAATDAGWEPLEHQSHLRSLMLCGANVTDSALPHIKSLTQITNLCLVDTVITDSGLKNIEGLTDLETLSLLGSKRITAAGLVHLKGLTQLHELCLVNTDVTGNGDQELQSSLPRLRITR